MGLVGASVTKNIRNTLPINSKELVLPSNGLSYIATVDDFSPLNIDNDEIIEMNDNQEQSLSKLKLSLDSGLIHERCIMSNKNLGLLCLCRMLRHELQQYTTTQIQNTQRP